MYIRFVLLSRYTASANVVAAQTIMATVIEFPTRNLGAYVVLYDSNGIHALKAYLSQIISEPVTLPKLITRRSVRNRVG